MIELVKNSMATPKEMSADLTGKTVVLSGATSGIGRETALLFAKNGADLVLLNRNPQKSAELGTELEQKFGCSVRTILVDFSSMDQTKACADELLQLEEPIDVLIHNAGVYYTKKTFSEDEIEIVFQVNHLSSFYINYLLKDKLKQENRARIIYVNSEGHRFALGGVHVNDLEWRKHRYSGLKSYGAAKTAQLLSMQKFVELFADFKVTVNAMHPGNVRSHIGENNGKVYRWIKEHFVLSSAQDPVISAQALLYLAFASELSEVSGKFYNLTALEKPAPHAMDIREKEPVWRKSLESCGLS